MALHPIPAQTNSRETLYAILGSAVIAIILASFITGNPFYSLTQAYRDYSKEPRAAAPTSNAVTVPGPAAATSSSTNSNANK